jgi:hypothetical protein
MSIFGSITGISLETNSFSEIIESIRSNDFNVTIEELRDQLALGNTELSDTIKKSLPAFTPSGIFDQKHKDNALLEYSEILHVDIDKLNKHEQTELETQLRASNDVLAFFQSPSGNGLKVFFTCNDKPENHTKNILKLLNVFEKRYHFKPDEKCKNLGRLCFFSYDPKAYYNPDAKCINLKEDNSKFERITLRIGKERNLRFTKGNRNDFVYQFALYCKNDNLNLAEVLNYAIANFTEADFTIDEIRATVNSAYKNDYSVRPKPKLSISKYDQIADAFAYLGYRFKRNVVKNSIDCCLGNNQWTDLTETIINDLLREVHNMGIKAKDTDIRTVLNSSLYETYDPFKEYLTNLEPWDGYDYILDLWTTLNVDIKYLPYLRKWLILLTAGILNEGINNPYVLTLIGPQGAGKTRWINKLIPIPLKEYMFQGILDLKDKDTKIALSENLIVNIDEIDALNRAETARLKEFISSLGYKVRAPYGKIQEFRRRRASFCASVNNPHFLTDKTGSRRYLCIEIPDKIDHMHKIDMDKVFAQTLAAYLAEEPLYFNDTETALIQERNEAFKSYSMEEELLSEYVRMPENGEVYKSISATEIARLIASCDETFKPNTRTNSEIGVILTNKGFARTKSGGTNKYKVVIVKTSQNSNNGWPVSGGGWGV